MNDYKLICIDVDGTLYDDHKVIPPANVTALQEASAKGIRVAITTGRMFNYGYLYGGLLGFETLTIASNGAYVRVGDEVLHHHGLTHAQVLEVKAKIDESGLFAHYNAWNTLLCSGPLGDGNGYLAANDKLPASRKIDIVVTEDLEPELEKRSGEILKAIVFSKGDLEALGKLREAFRNHPDLDVVASSRYNIEIIPKGVSKARGIEALIRHLGITPEEVIAIGDEENDLPMIRFAGMGVAMGNATDAVKAAANYITDTNNNAGVAQAVRKLCLE